MSRTPEEVSRAIIGEPMARDYASAWVVKDAVLLDSRGLYWLVRATDHTITKYGLVRAIQAVCRRGQWSTKGDETYVRAYHCFNVRLAEPPPTKQRDAARYYESLCERFGIPDRLRQETLARHAEADAMLRELGMRVAPAAKDRPSDLRERSS